MVTSTVTQKRRIIKDGEILPWFNAYALEELLKLDIQDWNVFEWGSGYGTLWFQNRVNTIISIEHKRSYYDLLKPQLKENCVVLQKKLIRGKSCPYDQVITKIEQNFDCIIVDGRNRVNCIMNSVNGKSKLKRGGFFILDNSERKRYKKGINLLNKYYTLYYKSPINFKVPCCKWETSIWINDK